MKADILKRFDLTGKVAVITGAGGGLCRPMCEALSAAGAKVVLLDIHLEKAEALAQTINKSGGASKALRCDVLDKSLIQKCYEEVRNYGVLPISD